MMNTLNGLKKFVALIFATAMAAALLTGCGHSTYFERGVYACYPRGAEDSEKTGFFVIEDENYGHTENGAYGGIGMAFNMAQNDGVVCFSYGEGVEDKSVLTIEYLGDNTIVGVYEDGTERVFEKIEGLDPATFDSVAYVGTQARADMKYI